MYTLHLRASTHQVSGSVWNDTLVLRCIALLRPGLHHTGRLVKREEQEIDGQLYVYLAYPSETITRSGYNIKRKHFGVIAVKKVCVCVCVCE